MENGSQLRPPLRCLPSIRTTARTGPACSTSTLETAPSKRSVLTAPWSSSSISGWRISTSRPFFAISVEPRVTDLTIVEPDLPIFAVMTPVEMAMVPPLLSTVTFFSGAAGRAGGEGELPVARTDRVRGPLEGAVGPVGDRPRLHGNGLAVRAREREGLVLLVGALRPGDADGGAGGRAEPAVLQPVEGHRVGVGGPGSGGGLRVLRPQGPAELGGGSGDGGRLEEGPAGDGRHRDAAFPCPYGKQIRALLRGMTVRGAAPGGADLRWGAPPVSGAGTAPPRRRPPRRRPRGRGPPAARRTRRTRPPRPARR